MRKLWGTLLQLFFRLLYNELAWTYDLVAWCVSLGQWRTWGRTAIPYLRGERVLELAHGPGHLLAAMAGVGLEPVGLDLSAHMGRLAQRKLTRRGVAVPLVRARAQVLPFRDGCFDSAVATFPTEFILDLATLQEAARVLRSPEGSPQRGQASRGNSSTARSSSARSALAEGVPGLDLVGISRRGPTGDSPAGRLVVVAWVRFHKRNLWSRFLAWFYRVTGQGEPLPGGNEMATMERWFVPSTVWQQVGFTQVMLVVAEERSNGLRGVRRDDTIV